MADNCPRIYSDEDQYVNVENCPIDKSYLIVTQGSVGELLDYDYPNSNYHYYDSVSIYVIDNDKVELLHEAFEYGADISDIINNETGVPELDHILTYVGILPLYGEIYDNNNCSEVTDEETGTIDTKEIKSLTINNKEVASIIRTSDNAILYEQPQESVPYVEFTFTGTTLTQYSYGNFQGTDMTIDYGDGTVETYTDTDNFYHTYAENGTYTVKIYGVTNIGKYCFKDCTGLTSINIPSSVTSIGEGCFEGCTNLNVTFNWTSASDVPYCNQWFNNTSNITLTLKPLIEGNNVLIYAQKYYPLEYLPSTNLSIVQQNTLTPNYPTQCATRYYTSNSIYYTRIYSWMPIPHHNEQIANFYFENGTYTKTTNNQPLSQTYVNVYSSTTASQTKKGTVTVTIPPYKDTTNNVYYTGIKYKVSFTGLTTSVKYLTITYLENDTYLTS